ncbi:MAG: hypothetical protein LBD45_05085, partial [Bacteroidales bacterium]|nr:hypothetical protein [Bacteroidales bacterium]
MKNYYYILWADAINAASKSNQEWKIILLIIFSVAQGLNLLTILFYVVRIVFDNKMKIFFDFHFLSGTVFNKFFSAFITLFLPFLIINYFLILHKDRYKVLLKKYQGFRYKGGIVFMLYFF